MSQAEQRAKIATGEGFIAALDQSGGSTPKALRLYGIGDDRYSTEAEMFDLVHAMRARIAQAPAFSAATRSSAPSSSRRPWIARSRASPRRATSGRSAASCPFSRWTRASPSPRTARGG